MADVDVVWEQTVDQGTFRCKVIGTAEYRGQLTVTLEQTGEVLLDEAVGLSYGAVFGPDVADVAEWQERSIKVIDEYIARHETPNG